MKTNNDLISTLVESCAQCFATEAEKQTFIDDWYFARAFIESNFMRERMCRVNEEGDITAPLALTLDGTSSKMRAVLRELILRAHYIDFDERDHSNASTITLLYYNSAEEMRLSLLATPFLGRYLHYLWEEPLPFLDINVVLCPKTAESTADITEQMLADFPYTRNNVIDTRTAEYANRIYCLGSDLYNLPAIDIANAEMYELPLQVFETENYEYNRDKNWENNSVRDKLSNVFCSDTFPLRKMMLQRGLKKDADNELSLTDSVRKNILPLTKCEHSRWVSEKLVMGGRPWTLLEHYQYDRLFGEEKNLYYKKLKKEGAHYNICSYHDLVRLEPQNLKFDIFLVLAMLEIIKKSENAII